jgi:peroxiredoxin
MFIKRLLAYGLLVVVAAALITLFVKGLLRSEGIAQQACMALKPHAPADAKPARPFALPDLNGTQKTLASYKGKLVLLHFWATWCPPCIEELPSLYRLQASMKDPRFELLTVSVDDSAKIVSDFFKKHRVPPLPILMDKGRKVAKSYGTTKFPETYLISPEGKLLYRFVNKRDWSSAVALDCLRSKLK